MSTYVYTFQQVNNTRGYKRLSDSNIWAVARSCPKSKHQFILYIMYVLGSFFPD